MTIIQNIDFLNYIIKLYRIQFYNLKSSNYKCKYLKKNIV